MEVKEVITRDVQSISYQLSHKSEQYTLSDKALHMFREQVNALSVENTALKKQIKSFFLKLNDHDKITEELGKKIEELKNLKREFDDYKEREKINIKQVEEILKKELKTKDVQIETLNQKLENMQEIELTFENQKKAMKDMEGECKKVRKDADEWVNQREIKLQMKFESLKSKMISNIQETEQKVKDLHFDHLDVTTKLTLLQNQQLLIELDFQNQKLKEIENLNADLKKRNFELTKDLEIHQEVELNLARKNKRLGETSKRQLETEGSINFDMIDPNDFKLNKRSSLEKKVKILESEVKEKKEEIAKLKGNYYNLQSRLQKYKSKYGNLFTIFDTCLEKIKNKIGQTGTENILIDVEELQKEAVEEIDDVSLANYVKLLAKLVIPLISAEDLRESTIKGIKFGTFLVKNRKAKFDIKLPEINEKMKFDRLRSLPKQAKLFSSLNIY